MMTEDQFRATALEIAELNGLTLEAAEEILAVIGDAPLTDLKGVVTLTDGSGRLHEVIWPDEEVEPDVEVWDRGITYEQVLRDIRSRGIAQTAEEYALRGYDPTASEEAIARAILAMEGTPIKPD